MSENKENNKQINGKDFKKKLSNKAWLIISTVLNIVLELDWQNSNWEA